MHPEQAIISVTWVNRYMLFIVCQLLRYSCIITNLPLEENWNFIYHHNERIPVGDMFWRILRAGLVIFSSSILHVLSFIDIWLVPAAFWAVDFWCFLHVLSVIDIWLVPAAFWPVDFWCFLHILSVKDIWLLSAKFRAADFWCFLHISCIWVTCSCNTFYCRFMFHSHCMHVWWHYLFLYKFIL